MTDLTAAAHVITELIAGDSNMIFYRPKFREITGHTLSTILLSRIIHWWHYKGKKKFFKFNQPTNHKLYRSGDSWLEELGFTRTEFMTARNKIATKISAGESKAERLKVFDEKGELLNASHLVLYWTDADRVTWYRLNEALFIAYVLKCFAGLANAGILHYISNAGIPHYQVNQDSCITFITIDSVDSTDKKDDAEASSPNPPSESLSIVPVSARRTVSESTYRRIKVAEHPALKNQDEREATKPDKDKVPREIKRVRQPRDDVFDRVALVFHGINDTSIMSAAQKKKSGQIGGMTTMMVEVFERKFDMSIKDERTREALLGAIRGVHDEATRYGKKPLHASKLNRGQFEPDFIRYLEENETRIRHYLKTGEKMTQQAQHVSVTWVPSEETVAEIMASFGSGS